jgi:uncharacterized delta-60 repeat protein
VTTDFFGFSDDASALVVQPDGRVVAAGGADNLNSTGFDFALARYNGDGSLDSSFGDGGRATTDFLGILDAAAGVALQPDGRIIAVGVASNDRFGLLVDFALSRYDKNGGWTQASEIQIEDQGLDANWNASDRLHWERCSRMRAYFYSHAGDPIVGTCLVGLRRPIWTAPPVPH